MGRDRFVKVEWGDARGKAINDFGHCDHGRKLASKEEAQVYQQLKADGYTVTKHGWPDFLAVGDHNVRLIEVKSSADYQRETQRHVHAALKRLGIDVETIVVEDPNRPRRVHQVARVRKTVHIK